MMPGTIEDQGGSIIVQLSFFLPNRLGALLRATRELDAKGIRICALSILDAADHAVVRMVVDRPTDAKSALIAEGYAVFETDLLGVTLPAGKGLGIGKVLSALLMAEVNIHYIYPLVVQADAHPVIVLHVDDMHAASRVLRQKGLDLIGQDDLAWPDSA
jgi:hypothetical protein